MPASSSAPRILIADDQRDVLEALKLLLKGEGYEVEAATSPRGVLSALDARDFDALLIDMNYTRDTTSGAEGFDLLTRLETLDRAPPVVVMTAWGSVDGAVEAMRRGARDYIEKPWDNRRLLATLRTQVELGRALRQSRQLELENRALRKEGFPELIAESPAMQPMLRLMERVGPSEANVLVLGEHGAGKEVVARWLHAASPRADRPLIAINVGGIPDGLFESELFGHVKGAFTDAKADRAGRFELADGGTLFLDEIANLPLAQQAKLLRVLETGEVERVGSSRARRVDARLISATNADPRAEVRTGRFREDLLFRLNTVEIRIPPLRERREDVPLLASHFLRRYAQRYRKPAQSFAPDAMEALLRHPWPGNVRELDHAVERAVLMAEGDSIQARDLALGAPTDGAAALEQMSLEEVEQVLVRKALARVGGNVSEAAKALGLSRSALYRRLTRAPLGGRLRRAYAVDPHRSRGRRLAGDRRDVARAGDPPAPNGLEHARRPARRRLLDARPRIEPERRPRPAPPRAEQSRGGLARPAAWGAGGDGAVGARDGRDRRGRVRVRWVARVAAREPRRRGAARTAARAVAGPQRVRVGPGRVLRCGRTGSGGSGTGRE